MDPLTDCCDLGGVELHLAEGQHVVHNGRCVLVGFQYRGRLGAGDSAGRDPWQPSR